MNLATLLPVPEGKPFSEWALEWLAQVKDDLYSVIEDDPNELRRRNERYASYLPYISTIVSVYRTQARKERAKFLRDNPKPTTGIKEWEERRDQATSTYRYTYDFLVSLREDIQRRASISQSALSYLREEIKNALD